MTDAEKRKSDLSEMEELKRLLLSGENKRLQALERTIDDKEKLCEIISEVLPAAIDKKGKKDEELINVLIPMIENVIGNSVKKNPKSLIDALFPLMGPSIRKAAYESIRRMIQNLNRALETTFSLKGLVWRLQALFTGRSYAEIVLLNNLIYQVEDVFLIHRESGLLLNQVKNDESLSQDGDMVSGMLKAIQDFVSDSFHLKRGDSLNTINVGGLQVWIEEGPYAILACVIRGTAPEKTRLVFKRVIEKIHESYFMELKNFNGHMESLAHTRVLLEECQQRRLKEKKKKSPNYFRVFAVVIGAALIFWGWLDYLEGEKWENFIDELKSNENVLITDVIEREGKYHIYGLSDNNGTLFDSTAGRFDLNVNEIEYHFKKIKGEFDRDGEYFEKFFHVPENINVSFTKGVLRLKGEADLAWVWNFVEKTEDFPEVKKIDLDSLKCPAYHRFKLLKDEIEDTRFYFDVNSCELNEKEISEISLFVDKLTEIQWIAAQGGMDILINIKGMTDTTGREEYNRELGFKRARTVYSLIKKKSGNMSLFRYYTLGSGPYSNFVKREDAEGRRENRNVRVEIKVMRSL